MDQALILVAVQQGDCSRTLYNIEMIRRRLLLITARSHYRHSESTSKNLSTKAKTYMILLLLLLESLRMTFTAKGKRPRLPLNLGSFLLIINSITQK